MNGQGKVKLTCKESLLNLPDCYILSSYDSVQRGQFYKGVIVQVTDSYILVLFFNNIQVNMKIIFYICYISVL